MKKIYPCVEVNLKKLTHNAKTILNMCDKKHIEVTSVTKVFCAQLANCRSYTSSWNDSVADSRILNLKNIKDLDCKKMLLRIPMISEAMKL